VLGFVEHARVKPCFGRDRGRVAAQTFQQRRQANHDSHANRAVVDCRPD
jgi:hypothetical protein